MKFKHFATLESDFGVKIFVISFSIERDGHIFVFI